MEPRSRRVMVSLTRGEKQTLARLAEYEGLSLAGALRHIILEAARQRRLWPPRATEKAQEEL